MKALDISRRRSAITSGLNTGLLQPMAINNLGMNLILIGQWDRAHEAFERALVIATEGNERSGRVSMILDSLGELCMLRGDLDEARSYLERAVAMATEHGTSGMSARPYARWPAVCSS